MTINPRTFQRPDWLQIWAGSWSALTCTHFAEEYSRLITFHGWPFLPESVIVVRHAKSEGWSRAQDRQDICDYLAKEIVKNTPRARAICRKLKKEADHLRGFMKKNQNLFLTEKLYNIFWEKLVNYYQPHINVKYVVDGLTPERLRQLLPYFEDARVYAENVLGLTEKFIEAFADKVGKKEKLAPHLVLCCTKEEIIAYFHTGKLPARSLLQKRDKLFAIYCDKLRYAVYDGDQAQNVVQMLTKEHRTDDLRGMTAHPGIVRGIVRIVHDPKTCQVFNTGDILVSGMTRPEFLPLMKKAGAFVTDSGGILSHAAITARELKKPCVINTKVATKVLKDGDKVEVDASRGIVRKLNH